MDETLEFVWACGLFEGEGTCGVWRNGTESATGHLRRTVSIQLVMTDLDVVERFHRAVGMGIIDGPIIMGGASKKPLYRWRARGDRVTKAALMTRMLPWLGERRRMQAQAVIDFGAMDFPPSRLHPDPITGIRPRVEDRESCINGHKITPNSTFVRQNGTSGCKQCRRDAVAKHRNKTTSTKGM